MLNSAYRDMLQVLFDKGVRFLLVGAYAMGVHGYPRATGDIDIWVEPSEEDSVRVYHARVEQANPAINELSPLLQIHTWGSLKGYRLSDWNPVHTLVFCSIGSAFLFMAYVRQIYDSRRAGAPAPPGGRSESAAAGRPDWP